MREGSGIVIPTVFHFFVKNAPILTFQKRAAKSQHQNMSGSSSSGAVSPAARAATARRSLEAPHMTDPVDFAEHMVADPDIDHFFSNEFEFQCDSLSFQDGGLYDEPDYGRDGGVYDEQDYGLSLSYQYEDLSFQDERLLLHISTKEVPRPSDPFVEIFNKWYESKTPVEREWLNSQYNAQMMVTLALNGFDNHMSLSGVRPFG